MDTLFNDVALGCFFNHTSDNGYVRVYLKVTPTSALLVSRATDSDPLPEWCRCGFGKGVRVIMLGEEASKSYERKVREWAKAA